MPPNKNMNPQARARADYGLDAPGVVATMALISAALFAASVIFHAIGQYSLGRTVLGPAVSLAAATLLMMASSRAGKLRMRDRLLDRLGLRGDETALDVGCGHGLLLLGAAKRLPRGRAIGIDLWSQKDQRANSASATMANAVAEGVAERVEVRSGDMRQLPFEDASVDVVLSSLAIHNLGSAEERAIAIREIDRVVRPGGCAGMVDISHVGVYASELRRAGWTIEHRGFTPWIFPPARVLVARKPR